MGSPVSRSLQYWKTNVNAGNGNSIVYRNHKVCDGFASLYDGSPSYIEL